MKVSSSAVIGLSSLTLGLLNNTATVSGVGIQSGPTQGSLYAGSVYYDATDSKAYLVGASYDTLPFTTAQGGVETRSQESSCFLAAVDMDTMEFTSDSAVIGSPNVLEVCSSLAFLPPGDLVILGNAEEGGLGYNSDGSTSQMHGFALTAKRQQLTAQDSVLRLETSDPARIPYPMSVVDEGGFLYIASLTSADDELQTTPGEMPNWIEKQKYGSTFDMTITRIQLIQKQIFGVAESDLTITESWTHEFKIQPETDGTVHRVYLAGMINKFIGGGQFLIVAGSTRGRGQGYGPGGGDHDNGFITILDPNTGGSD